MPQSPLRLGTRASKLALAQAHLVAGALAAKGVAARIVTVTTGGDRIQDRPLADAGGKGLFTKELEERLAAGEIDLAVHSMKDVPALLPDGLAIAAVLKREDPTDVLVSRQARTLAELPKGARLGTSSVRRMAQVRRARPDLDCVLLRGNVDTRLARLDRGEMDAILLARAGLVRLGLQDRITAILDPAEWLPALSQGAVGIETRESDADLVRALDDGPSAIALACERAFQAALDGSCRTPIAGLATLDGDTLRFRGEVIAPDGSDFAATEFALALGRDPARDAARAGREAGLGLRPRASQWLQA